MPCDIDLLLWCDVYRDPVRDFAGPALRFLAPMLLQVKTRSRSGEGQVRRRIGGKKENIPYVGFDGRGMRVEPVVDNRPNSPSGAVPQPKSFVDVGLPRD